MVKSSNIQHSSRFYNMDLVRYLMAFSVIVAHYNVLTENKAISWMISSGTAVSVFFGLSGFLVYASYLKHPDLKRYIGGRVRRIVPAYSTIVLGFAVGLVLLSSSGILQYFGSMPFWKYIVANLCFLNFLEPNLPGVFTENPITAVNGSLWTLKVEWFLYLTIPLFFWWNRKMRWNVPQTAILLYLFSMVYNIGMEYWAEQSGSEMIHKLSYQFTGQFMFFYSGVLCYHFLDYLRQHFRVLLCVDVALVGLLMALPTFWDNRAVMLLGDLIRPMAYVLLAILISIAPVMGKWQEKIPNFSYEMYLVHFPIIQIAVATHVTTAMPIGFSFTLLCGVIVLCAWGISRWAQWLLSARQPKPVHLP